MINYIDSHFHLLSMRDKDIDLTQLFSELKADGFAGGIDIGTVSYDFKERMQIINKLENIVPSIGSGPWQLNEDIPIDKMLRELETTLTENKETIVAIGEFGLDYYWNYGTKEKQFDLAKEQIALANQYNLPVLLHNRDADRDFEKLLDKYPPKTTVLHCFSGDTHLADFARERKIYLSFSCNITYKKNNELREIASSYLEDRILCETDSPYLPPQKKRGKLNTPLNVKEAYTLVSELRGINIESFLSKVQENYNNLLQLDKH